MKALAALLLALPLGAPQLAGGQETQVAPDSSSLAWTPVQAEHLLNRAGFGATSEEIALAVAAGPEAVVDRLLAGGRPAPAFEFQVYRVDRRARAAANDDERRELDRAVRQNNRKQVDDFSKWWLEQMVAGQDPLRERMTLILHGWLVSAHQKVQQSDYLVAQNQLFRSYALGNYGKLLRAILEDPAMLLYLDNNTNNRRKPNENLARELMELFSLGEGQYTEEDIREAARALTGYTVREEGFFFAKGQHDPEEKYLLGYSGVESADGLVEVLLEQPACAEYVAKRLINEFEGADPSPMRLQSYAKLLRDSKYELEPFLRTLFLDPAFYRDEVMGTKVLSPIEYVVGTARRLQVPVPAELLYQAASMLGQTLLDPPSVKGWDGGFAWLTESSLMLRSNAWGAILGEISGKDLRDQVAEAIDMMDGMMDDPDAGQETPPEPKRRGGPLVRLLTTIQRDKLAVEVPVVAWLKQNHKTSDEEIAQALLEECLAIPVPAETQRLVQDFLREGRKRLNLHPGKLLTKPDKAQKLLMQTLHLILSLPEANLG